MLDFDLAEMYGTETKVLKQSVKRNIKRFPYDFMFELTKDEWNNLVTICDQIPKSMKHSYVPSFAFTNEIFALLKELLEHKKEVEKPSNPIGFITSVNR